MQTHTVTHRDIPTTTNKQKNNVENKFIALVLSIRCILLGVIYMNIFLSMFVFLFFLQLQSKILLDYMKTTKIVRQMILFAIL